MIASLRHSAWLVALSVIALPALGQEVYRDNVVIVLDASGSMRKVMRSTGTVKMDAAKAALKEVLQQVPETTHLGLVVFSARNVQQDWIYPLGPREDEKLLRAIDLPQPGGGTPLGRYMKIAADRLLEERAKQYGYGTYRLLVVTDGAASDTQRVETYTPEIMARGITVDVIGVDMTARHTLATKVHSYRSANDPESLKQAVKDVFAEISSDSGADADADAFAVIADLPSELAEGMLTALATSGNYPIGGRPDKRGRAGAEPVQAPQQRPKAAPVSQQQPARPASPPVENEDSGGFKLWQISILVIIVILAITRGNRRRRRR